MRRADRLNNIVHHLRRMRGAVTGQQLADAFEVCPRTIYRDIQDLMASGVPIDGEPGVGYRLDKKYHLPPVMFDADELEAIALGVGMVRNWTDEAFARKAESAYEKIQAVLPARMLHDLEQLCTFSAPSHYKIPWEVNFSEVRECIRQQRKIRFDYTDLQDRCSHRVIRPLALISFSPVWLLAGWCELRQAFRNFRLDRISGFEALSEPCPRDPDKTLAAYRKAVGAH